MNQGSGAEATRPLAGTGSEHQISPLHFKGDALAFDLGFETVGNATLILHDGAPILATDPWITGPAYFGSWGLAHQIPAEQLEAIRRCKYLWISHGHPDHLSGDSLALLRDKEILVPDHEGSRVYNDLKAQGFNARVLPSRKWVELTPRIHVVSVSDYNQDAILLADVNGRLVLNFNDAGDRGWGGFVRGISRRYARTFFLNLCSFGEADMLNFYDDSGQMLPLPTHTPLGATLSRRANLWGVSAVIPFSALHRYQRTDSAWVNRQAATLADYADGFDTSRCELLPAYLRYDCVTDDVTPLNPPPSPDILHEPQEFGDDWKEPLDAADKEKLRKYFTAFEHLKKNIDFLRFRVGGEETIVELRSSGFHRGLTFEVPRASLMSAVSWEIFDDLLIGNFMRVTLHGEWGPDRLYPDFAPYVAKYGDNGRAKSLSELRNYHRKYFRRDPASYLRHKFDVGFVIPLQKRTASFLRSRVGANSAVFRETKKAYWALKAKMI
jgi:hypothetical protein